MRIAAGIHHQFAEYIDKNNQARLFTAQIIM